MKGRGDHKCAGEYIAVMDASCTALPQDVGRWGR